jgi:hypothetical protein
MGLISTTVAPQSSIIAQNNTADGARAAESAKSNASQNSVATGNAAAVVQLANGTSKGRGASTGPNKSVDAAFEKQQSAKTEPRSEKADKGDDEAQTGQLVNVTA